MKISEVEVGKVYTHRWQGHNWKVRVQRIEPRYVHCRREWKGVLVGDQGTCFDGDAVWGYVSELQDLGG